VRWALVRNPKAFVFRVLRNEANRFLRRRINERAGERTNPGEVNGPASVIERQNENAASLVAGALAQLPDEQKEMIILKIFQDFSFKEIASICGLSINTAASRYRYGIEKLRSSLEGKV
jgi:RNA polymerase sigma-70 factor (ECF subfamily)